MFCPVTELMSDSQDLHHIDLKILISHTMVGTKSESGFPLETRRLRKTPQQLEPKQESGRTPRCRANTRAPTNPAPPGQGWVALFQSAVPDRG